MIIEDHILLKYISNSATEQEVEKVEKWMDESLQNRKHYQRLLTVHFESNHLKTFNTSDVEAEWNDFLNNRVVFHEPIENSLPHRKIFLYATAASIVLISAFLFLFQSEPGITRNASDKQLSFKLPDNSAVTLYPNSSITYNEDYLEAHERNIELVGKARFNVMPNRKSPFIVKSDLITTKVLGTVFSVDTYNPSVPSVNVEQGTVSVIEKEQKSNVRILKKGDSVAFANGDFLDVISSIKKVVPKVVPPPKKKSKAKKKKPVVKKQIVQPEPKPKAPIVKKPTPSKPKLSAYPVNEALKFLTKQHDNFSKSRKAKMKGDNIVMLNLNLSLEEILEQFKKDYNLELEKGKCEGCVKLKKISKK